MSETPSSSQETETNSDDNFDAHISSFIKVQQDFRNLNDQFQAKIADLKENYRRLNETILSKDEIIDQRNRQIEQLLATQKAQEDTLVSEIILIVISFILFYCGEFSV